MKVIYTGSNPSWICGFRFSSIDEIINHSNWSVQEVNRSNGHDFFSFACPFSYSPSMLFRVSLVPFFGLDLFTGEISQSTYCYSYGLYRSSFRLSGHRVFIGSRPINRKEIEIIYNRLCSRFIG